MSILKYITTFFILITTVSSTVQAQDVSQVPFTVDPHLPNNQVDNVGGYFSLEVEPEHEQELEVTINNRLTDDLTVTMEPVNAYTHPSGGIIYSEDASENAFLLDDDFAIASNMSVEEGSVTIPAESSVDVSIDLTVPDVEAENLLGGILFTSEGIAGEEVETEGEESNFVVETEVAIAMAVQLNLPFETEQNFSFGEAGFLPNNAQIYLEMTNEAPFIQNNVSGEYEVYDDADDMLMEGEFGSFNMAPMSQMTFPFRWDHPTLDPGTYTVAVDTDINGQQITEERTFTIEEQQVEEYVERNMPEVATQTNDQPWLWVFLGSLGGALIIGTVMFLVFRRK
ncbi:WxL protein peptidoglycan domain-containing protein [Texcoconibacillus texcoconensis]|uniref:DUF3324 domain-containing protein n=1 Tax=Texcoconibacillus texcoconensis TaxID=1095777 RepID=A0A840QSV2_9BACI|nr:DUF916 domain-containing protein [Texcoconibacillus texcoconensis]MBB5174606.1 hypothetical protein [Texcoconibacillus texcoconensis]